MPVPADRPLPAAAVCPLFANRISPLLMPRIYHPACAHKQMGHQAAECTIHCPRTPPTPSAVERWRDGQTEGWMGRGGGKAIKQRAVLCFVSRLSDSVLPAAVWGGRSAHFHVARVPGVTVNPARKKQTNTKQKNSKVSHSCANMFRISILS